MWNTEYRRGCCSFDVFFTGFIAAARNHHVPLVLIDKLQARRHWRCGMTGHEALLTQRKILINEAEYRWLHSI